MDLQDQLKQLFPDSIPEKESSHEAADGLWISDQVLACKYEKRNGKPYTQIDGYDGNKEDFKELLQLLQKSLGVGGSIKKESILIQGDYRDNIMNQLQEMGFKVKRVGG